MEIKEDFEISIEFIKDNCKTIGDLKKRIAEHKTPSRKIVARESPLFSRSQIPNSLTSGFQSKENFAEKLVNEL